MTLLTDQSGLATPTRFCSHCSETLPESAFAPGHRCCLACARRASESARLRAVKVNATRTFGVEIECKVPSLTINEVAAKIRRLGIACNSPGYTHQFVEAWKVVPDGTVHGGERYVDGHYERYYGMEVVSPILRGSEGVAQLKKITKLLKRLGAFVDRGCGLHVHHDAHDLALPAWKTLARMYVRYEPILDGVVPASRRGDANSMCHSMRRWHSETTALQRIDNAYDLQALRQVFGDRFVKLNVTSFWRHGTVEFRHFGGTTDFAKILNWVAFTQSMVESAHRGAVVSPRVAPTEAKLMSLVKPPRSVRRWFTDRAAAFAAAA